MQAQIHQFWYWFNQNQAQFKNIQNPERVRELLDNQLLVFGKVSWGIDMPKKDEYVLTISPNGDEKLFYTIKRLVEFAPNLSDWDFRYCKPPELDWDFQFEAFNTFYILQKYDASEWSFVLIEEEDYRIRVEIKTPNLDSLDLEEKLIAIDMAVTRLLGEELRIKEVHSVTLTHQFESEDKDWIYPMKEFRKRFLDFIE